jgi:hypothetical protein
VQSGTGPAGAAVTVNGSTSDVVVFCGLTLKGEAGKTGIRWLSGGTLHLEGLRIRGFVTSPDGFPGLGIEAGQGVLTIKDTLLEDNANGIDLRDGLAVLDHCSLCGDGTRLC